MFMSHETNDSSSPQTFSFSSESLEISGVEYTVEEMETIFGSKIDQDSTTNKVPPAVKNLAEANPVIRKNNVSGLYSGTLGT